MQVWFATSFIGKHLLIANIVTGSHNHHRSEQVKPRIVGGKLAKAGQIPYQVIASTFIHSTSAILRPVDDLN